MKRLLYLIISIYIVTGCGGGETTSSSLLNNNVNFNQTKRDININDSGQVEVIKGSLNSDITLHIANKKDIYIVVTSYFNNQYVSINSSLSKKVVNSESSNYTSLYKLQTQKLLNEAKYREFLDLLHQKSTADDRLRLDREITRDINSISLNDTETFCVDMDLAYNCRREIRANIKKIVKNINTPTGVKSLVIWLEEGNNQVNQTQIDRLANMFLKEGTYNDIYDWVANVYGNEWGNDAKSIDNNLIGNSNIIDILLYSMDNNYLAGYFWGKDNFVKSKINASNEKIMFYLNTKLLNENPNETYTTIAHEFQHMIHFYQRGVLKDLHDSTWFDELMSEAIEDLISVKIGYVGPRNVDPNDGTAGEANNNGGRFPIFNKYNTASLVNWSSSAIDYSKVSSFGAFLLRNYNGGNILKSLMNSDYLDEGAVLDATKEQNFATLANKWASAVILSDKININSNLAYNFGDYKYTNLNGVDYPLGSINFFNYIPGPTFKQEAILNKYSNLYYKLGSDLEGDINIKIEVDKGVDIAIIAK